MIHRLRGGLDGLTDSEQRPLRPVGSSVREVAARTGRLLTKLRSMPGVRVCAGVRIGDDHLPIGFAITAGTQVMLIESVAWPVGSYTVAADGRVLCDGIYIGQSVGPLIGSIHRLRHTLPPHHRVSAVIVVHPYGAGPSALPESTPAALTWVRPVDAAGHIGYRLRRGRRGSRAPRAGGRSPAELPGMVNSSPRPATPRG